MSIIREVRRRYPNHTFLSISEFADAMNRTERWVYTQIGNGHLEVKYVGARPAITFAAIKKFLDSSETRVAGGRRYRKRAS